MPCTRPKVYGEITDEAVCEKCYYKMYEHSIWTILKWAYKSILTGKK